MHLDQLQQSILYMHWLTSVCEGDNIVVKLDNELSPVTRYGCISAAWIKYCFWSLAFVHVRFYSQFHAVQLHFNFLQLR